MDVHKHAELIMVNSWGSHFKFRLLSLDIRAEGHQVHRGTEPAVPYKLYVPVWRHAGLKTLVCLKTLMFPQL